MSSTIIRAVRSVSAVACSPYSKNAVQRAVYTSQAFSDSGAVDKVRNAFEEYRLANYTQTLPSRFKKEVICAVDKNQTGMISLDDMDRLMINIGAADKITRSDLECVLSQMGLKRTAKNFRSSADRSIPVDKIKELL